MGDQYRYTTVNPDLLSRLCQKRGHRGDPCETCGLESPYSMLQFVERQSRLYAEDVRLYAQDVRAAWSKPQPSPFLALFRG